MTQQVDAVVIGSGQAGLAMSYFLTQQGRTHVVLEQAAQVGHAWRDRRWNSFTLVTPNWSVQLPGFPYRGENPDGYMSRAEVVAQLEQYASSFQAPVQFEKQVTAVDPGPDGNSYLVFLADGGSYASPNVVVATGSFQFPRPTSVSDALPRHIVQVHSSFYRNPGSLPPGAVLVVGSADTGCQLAEELSESGRQVYLCVGRGGRVPRRYRGRDAMFWGVTMGKFEQTVDQLPTPGARFGANPQLTGKNGGHTLNLHRLARNGVVLLGRLVGVDDNTIVLAADLAENLSNTDKWSDGFKNDVDAFVLRSGMEVPSPEADPIDEDRFGEGVQSPATLDLQAAGVTSVVWANGYGFDYRWVHMPVLDAWGFPVQQRGVTGFPGLYFLGMNLLHSRKSGILFGVGEDAEHIAAHMAATAR